MFTKELRKTTGNEKSVGGNVWLLATQEVMSLWNLNQKFFQFLSGISDDRWDKVFRIKEWVASSIFLKNGKEISCLRTKNGPSP